MKYTSLGSGPVQTFALAFEAGDEAMQDIAAFARAENVAAARFFGVGGFSEATLGYFDRAEQRYEPIAIGEQVELLSILGNICLKDGAPLVHAHAVVGHRDGSVRGGHVLRALVWPTLELFVDVYPVQLVKVQQPSLGIATIAVDRTIG